VSPRFHSCRRIWSTSPHRLESGGIGFHISPVLLAEGDAENETRWRGDGGPANRGSIIGLAASWCRFGAGSCNGPHREFLVSVQRLERDFRDLNSKKKKMGEGPREKSKTTILRNAK
jgi:hypothetical protein